MLSLLFAPGLSYAQTQSADQAEDADQGDDTMLVVGVNSRLPDELSTFPGSVTLLDSEAIGTQLAITGDVGQMLAYEVPGLSTASYSASDFGQSMRGRPVAYYIDGVPISVPLRNGGRALRAVSASALGGVEVIRGATALYGNGGVGGSINYITKRVSGGDGVHGASDVSLGMSLTHPEESFRPRAEQSLTAVSGPADFVFVGSYENVGAFFDADGDRIISNPNGNGGISESDIYNVYSRAGLNFGDSRVEASVMYYDQKQDTNYGLVVPGDQVAGVKATAEYGQPDPRAVGEFNTNLVAQASYINTNVLGGTFRAQVYHQDIEQLSSWNASRAGGSQSMIRSRKDGLRLDFNTPLKNIGIDDGQLLWGGEIVRDRSVQTVNTDPAQIFVPELDQKDYAAFAQLEVGLIKGLSMQGGVRYDHFKVEVEDFTVLTSGLNVNGGETDYDSVVFNIGAVQEVTSGLSVYAAFSQGFSLPDIGRSLRATTEVDPIVTLRPEPIEIDSYEAGIRGNLPWFSYTLAGFYSESSLGQTFEPDPLDPFAKIVVRAAEKIHGIEGTLNGGAFQDQLLWGGTFSWVAGKTDSNDDGVVDTPLPNDRVGPIKVTGYVSYDITPDWSVRVQGIYSGDRNAFPDIAYTSRGSNGELDSFSVFDISTKFKLGPGDMTVSVSNMLNNFYFGETSMRSGNRPERYAPSPGATAKVGYRVAF